MKLIIVENNPILTVAANYVSGDYVGTSGVAMIFANCARGYGGGGMIPLCVLSDAALQSVSGELWLFDTAPTPPADSAAWSISDANNQRCIGVIPFSTYYASALNSVSYGISTQPLGFKCLQASRDLYGCFVTRGAPTYASLDLLFKLSILWNE